MSLFQTPFAPFAAKGGGKFGRTGTNEKKGMVIIMRSKDEFTVRIDSELYKKLLYVAQKENSNLNNHILSLIRTNVSYYEKVHGRIKPENLEKAD